MVSPKVSVCGRTVTEERDEGGKRRRAGEREST